MKAQHSVAATCHARGIATRGGRILLWILLAILCGPAAALAQPNAPQVRGAVVDLEIHRAEATPLHATAFRLDGAGLVTCRRLVAGADWVAA
ncbi:MAG: hypothetical protein GF330_08260, partial [Candidatus Eisenbacteria bacterium]|nr:hypothetical protein [Candidatus Eisenbacteria bacterium]